MNTCIFSGRITKDAELKYTAASNTPYSEFSLAVESGFGEYKRVDFPNFVLWNREKLAQYLTRGKAVVVVAEFKQNNWTDSEGAKRRTVDFVVSNLEFQQGNKKVTTGEGGCTDSFPPEDWEKPVDDVPF